MRLLQMMVMNLMMMHLVIDKVVIHRVNLLCAVASWLLLQLLQAVTADDNLIVGITVFLFQLLSFTIILRSSQLIHATVGGLTLDRLIGGTVVVVVSR